MASGDLVAAFSILGPSIQGQPHPQPVRPMDLTLILAP